jgi:hypothetical protein
MRVQPFALGEEQPPRLELRWDGTQAHIFLDGAQTATLDGFSGLKKGWSTTLEDGSRLEVRTIRRPLFSELSVLRDGQHIRSSPSHPDRMLRSCSNVLLALSVFLLVAGIFGLWGRDWIDATFGGIYLGAAVLLRNRRRLGAAVAAVPLFIKLDFLLIEAFAAGIDRPWAIDLALNLLFATFVVRAYRAYQAAHDSRSLQRSESVFGV